MMHSFALLAFPLLAFAAIIPTLVSPRNEAAVFGFPIAPRVMLISMYDQERDVWLGPLNLVHNVTVPGLSMLFPQVHCDVNGYICQMTTGEGEINAASSAMALFVSPWFSLQKTYFFIAGVAGGNPYLTTTGSAAFARYAVQVALQFEVDSREIPSNWSTGYFAQGTYAPDQYPGMANWYGTEVFELNTHLLDRVVEIAWGIPLNDSSDAAAFRALYDYAPANQLPRVVQCDVATSDNWFTGALLAEAFGNVTKIWTNNTGEYCATAQEDNGTLEAAVRAHLAGLVDYSRFILLRTISDFDRPPPSLTAIGSLYASLSGTPLALTNMWTVGYPIVSSIAGDWPAWENGFPPPLAPGYGDVLGSLL